MRFVFALPKGFRCAATLETLCGTAPQLSGQLGIHLSLKGGILNTACVFLPCSTRGGNGVQ